MHNSRNYYNKILRVEKDYKSFLIKFLQAFFFGGLISIIGQSILEIYSNFFEREISTALLSMTMILFAGILTAIGKYDDLGQIAKCGLAIPITGFANACVSSAMEYHKEGIVLGVAGNCFKLAGSVIVLGTASAVIVASIRYLFEVVLWHLNLMEFTYMTHSL